MRGWPKAVDANGLFKCYLVNLFALADSHHLQDAVLGTNHNVEVNILDRLKGKSELAISSL